MKSRWAVWILGGLPLVCGCVQKGSIEEYFIRRNGECDDIKQQPNPDGTILVYGCHKAETYRCFETKKFGGYYYQHTNTAPLTEWLYDEHGFPIGSDGHGEGYRRVPMYYSQYTCGAVDAKQPQTPPSAKSP